MTAAQTDIASRKGAQDWLSLAVLVGGVTFALLGLYGRIMGYGLSRDEMMFVSPAGLPEAWALYRDVFYNHVPYSAYIFDAVADLLPLGLLESARLVVLGAWLALIAATWTIVARISGSTLIALVSVVMLITNATLLSQVGAAATNNFLPLPFAFVGVGLFVLTIIERHVTLVRMLAVGVCLGVACGMKVSAVAYVVPVALAAFVAHRHLDVATRLRRVVLPILCGGLIAGAPVLFLMVRDFDLFFAHVVGFHTGPHVAYWRDAIAAGLGDGVALGLGDKLQLAYAAWLSGSGLLLALLIAVLFTVGFARFGVQGVLDNPALWVVLCTLAATAAMSFVPTPAFIQYYAPPLVLLPLLLAVLARDVLPMRDQMFGRVLVATMVLMGLLGLPRLAPGVATTLQLGDTTVASLQRGGAELERIAAASAHPENPVATFLPLYPLEAGLPVYAELATGQFAYRIKDVTAPELAAHYAMAGPSDIAALFAQTPPSVILVGYEPRLEAPMIAWAEANGYVAVESSNLNNRYGTGFILTQPAVSVRGASHTDANPGGISSNLRVER